jgi:ribosome-associated protein
MLRVSDSIVIPRSELQMSFSRSPGPGGQNVNKVNSKVTLRWDVRATSSLPLPVKQRFLARYGNRISRDGTLILTSHRYRDQPRNISDVLEKLRQLILAIASAPKKRKPVKPSKAANRKRLDQKRRKSEKKSARRNVRFDD